MRVDENKTEIFSFPATKLISLNIPSGKEIYTTAGTEVLSASKRREMDIFMPCTQEEADTRLMLHALDASLCGHRKITLRSNDSDAVMLVISVAETLSLTGFE